jgi:hypothetical protein
MKRKYLKSLSFMIAIIVFLMIPSAIFAEQNACTPSTNDINRDNGWSHVDLISQDIGEVTLEFIQPRYFVACFEYRTDGDTSQIIGPTNYNTCITDGLYPYFCLNNKGGSETMRRTETMQANEYVEVRMVFGGETDERFDWTRFDVLPEPVKNGADKASLYDSTPFTCDDGASDLSGETYGFVVMNINSKGGLIVEVSLKGATPNETYDIWVNQNPGACPLNEPTAPSALTTNGKGNGNAKVKLEAVDGATNFWVSAVGGGQVLRSVAVELR